MKYITGGFPPLATLNNVKQMWRGGETLLVASNKIKQTRRRGFPPSSRQIKAIDDGEGWPSSSHRISQTHATGRVSPPRRVEQVKQTRRGGSPLLVALNKSNRRDGEGFPSPSRLISSNRHNREGLPSSSRWISQTDAMGRVSPPCRVE